ncbi:MAG: hypothetical protein ACM3PP_03965 [Candidatus Saccharibacteria bacterium]
MEFIKPIKEFFFGKDITAYWDERATIAEYHLYLEEHPTCSHIPSVNNSDELLFVATMAVGHIDFDSQTRSLPDYFVELEEKHIIYAVGLGILGSLVAWEVDRYGKDLEEFINNHLPKLLENGLSPEEYKNYDKNSPFDIKKGNAHRYYLFHDLFGSWFQKVPGDFMVNGIPIYEIVGKQPGESVNLIDLLCKTYSIKENSAFSNVIRIVNHCIVHILKDIVTSDGLPLPFSSLFTEFKKESLNLCGYRNSNTWMDSWGREYGSIHSSDFASILVMKAVMTLYLKYGSKNLTKDARLLFEHQLNCIMYATCMIVQLMLLIRGKSVNPQKNITGGKLNIVMAGLFIKNCINTFTLLAKDDKVINQEYREMINKYDSIIRKYEASEGANNNAE